MTDLYDRINALTTNQRALLAHLIHRYPETRPGHELDGANDNPASASTDNRLVAYIVPTGEQAPTFDELRRFLSEKVPDYMIPSAFITLAALPLTPNGKVDRQALPTISEPLFEIEDDFAAPRTQVEETLTKIWAEVLDLDIVSIHDNFFELGGDSILSIQIIAKANQAGLKLTPRQIFDCPTIAQLAMEASIAAANGAEQKTISGSVPLTPIQHWFFEQKLPEPQSWNQAFLLEVPASMNANLLETALQHLQHHHDVLRLGFTYEADGWQQVITEPSKNKLLTQVDLSKLPETEQQAVIEATAMKLQAKISLSHGVLMHAALFNLGSSRASRLLIVIHHLAVDGVSWWILFNDLETAYKQLSRGEDVRLPAKTTSYKYWSEKLREYAQSSALTAELDYWLAIHANSVTPIPLDFPGPQLNTEGSSKSISVSLEVEETSDLLHQVPAAYNTQINDVLLTALVLTFARWTGAGSLLLGLEGHGREDFLDNIDTSRSVGWFTSFFPVLLKLESSDNLGEALKAVKEQLRRIPNRGIGYGLLRYLSNDPQIAAKLKRLPQAEILFNYAGQLDQILAGSSLLSPAREPIGPMRSPQNHRSHLLEINAAITDGRLTIEWRYSQNIHKRETIAKLADNFLAALREIIAHCVSQEAGGYTPSDFGLADLDDEELNQLANLLDTIDNAEETLR